MADAAGRISLVPGGVSMVGAVPGSLTWAWVAGAIEVDAREAIEASRMVEICDLRIFMFSLRDGIAMQLLR